MDQKERNKKLAELKSSIMLLEECKEKVKANEKLDEDSINDRVKEIDEAIRQNYEKARAQYNATKKEVDGSSYNTVKDEYVLKYEERLKKKGLTDEQLHQKEMAVIIDASPEENVVERKRHRRTKRTEQRDDESGFDPTDIVRVKDEEELMRKSMVKDSKEVEALVRNGQSTVSDKPINKTQEDVVVEVMDSKKIKEREKTDTIANVVGEKKNRKHESKRVVGDTSDERCDYKFDLNDIPSNIQYDIIPLPSNGECYPHKKSRIPVAYLTAADENIIASPNMYRDGKILDIILERKILDKSINVSELCKGDRDAIILWLRATGYGTDFPIYAIHPETRKQYPVNVQLDKFKYYPFSLKGDENGYFDYITESGDTIKFKYLSIAEENELRDEIISSITDFEKFSAIKNLGILQQCFGGMGLSDGDMGELNDCIADIKDIIKADDIDVNIDNMYNDSITKQMVNYTVSVNGNSDREFVRSYIENMRSRDAYAYRTFVNDNVPGVNMKIIVNVPKSDGGGTFETFLGLNDYVFSNI